MNLCRVAPVWPFPDVRGNVFGDTDAHRILMPCETVVLGSARQWQVLRGDFVECETEEVINFAFDECLDRVVIGVANLWD